MRKMNMAATIALNMVTKILKDEFGVMISTQKTKQLDDDLEIFTRAFHARWTNDEDMRYNIPDAQNLYNASLTGFDIALNLVSNGKIEMIIKNEHVNTELSKTIFCCQSPTMHAECILCEIVTQTLFSYNEKTFHATRFS